MSEVNGRLTRFGFEWGPVEVSRASELPGGRVCLIVRTAHREIEIYATPGGRSLRVFQHGDNGGELKVVGTEEAA